MPRQTPSKEAPSAPLQTQPRTGRHHRQFYLEKETSEMQKIKECESESPSGFTISHKNRRDCILCPTPAPPRRSAL